MVGELVNGSKTSIAASAELLNRSDVALIQHEYGVYGAVDGEEVVEVGSEVCVPSITLVVLSNTLDLWFSPWPT